MDFPYLPPLVFQVSPMECLLLKCYEYYSMLLMSQNFLIFSTTHSVVLILQEKVAILMCAEMTFLQPKFIKLHGSGSSLIHTRAFIFIVWYEQNSWLHLKNAFNFWSNIPLFSLVICCLLRLFAVQLFDDSFWIQITVCCFWRHGWKWSTKRCKACYFYGRLLSLPNWDYEELH